jgi:hypothetical protein
VCGVSLCLKQSITWENVLWIWTKKGENYECEMGY